MTAQIGARPPALRRWFWRIWLMTGLVKWVLIWQLPCFVDEAFYWQEGQHLAWAYADLPGATAWLACVGLGLGGHHLVAMRAPFLVLAMTLPCMAVRVARVCPIANARWWAGIITCLMPLSGVLGVFALPDVPLAVATLVCLDAIVSLLTEKPVRRLVECTLGLGLGAWSHYRFIGMLGSAALATVPVMLARDLWRSGRMWVVLLVGGMAWWPLFQWNWQHHAAGIRFQLRDRHPWQFSWFGLNFLWIQVLLLTPMVVWAVLDLVQVMVRTRRSRDWPWQYVAWIGVIATVSLFVLGFFADRQRVSFHWPIPGYLALFCALPVVVAQWSAVKQVLLLTTLGCAFVGGVLGTVVLSGAAGLVWPSPPPQAARNFADTRALMQIDRIIAQTPGSPQIIVDSFKTGAQLGFFINRADLAVLPHPLNSHHGRAEQLRQWGLLIDKAPPRPWVLVLAVHDQRPADLLAYYHQLCRWLGPLPKPQVVGSLTHGQRFVVLPWTRAASAGACVTPALAWIDHPVVGIARRGQVAVDGWAFKDGVGVARIAIVVDGQIKTWATYGDNRPIQQHWPSSTDPFHPHVGFHSLLDTSGLTPGRHWLSLRIDGRDGSTEQGWWQPLTVTETQPTSQGP